MNQRSSEIIFVFKVSSIKLHLFLRSNFPFQIASKIVCELFNVSGKITPIPYFKGIYKTKNNLRFSRTTFFLTTTWQFFSVFSGLVPIENLYKNDFLHIFFSLLRKTSFLKVCKRVKILCNLLVFELLICSKTYNLKM